MEGEVYPRVIPLVPGIPRIGEKIGEFISRKEGRVVVLPPLLPSQPPQLRNQVAFPMQRVSIHRLSGSSYPMRRVTALVCPALIVTGASRG